MTLIDKLGVACCASGKAGGFLALDWCDGNELGGLARPSFYLHEKVITLVAPLVCSKARTEVFVFSIS